MRVTQCTKLFPALNLSFCKSMVYVCVSQRLYGEGWGRGYTGYLRVHVEVQEQLSAICLPPSLRCGLSCCSHAGLQSSGLAHPILVAVSAAALKSKVVGASG